MGRKDIKRKSFRETGDKGARKKAKYARKETIRIYIVVAFSFSQELNDEI